MGYLRVLGVIFFMCDEYVRCDIFQFKMYDF